MTVRVLPRGHGIVLVCNKCGATTQTASISITGNRAYAASLGWGRGRDKGTPHRAARPATPTVRDTEGKITTRAVRALAEIPGRPKTTKHDLCPPCLKLDRDAAEARHRVTAERRGRRDAARKAA